MRIFIFVCVAFLAIALTRALDDGGMQNVSSSQSIQERKQEPTQQQEEIKTKLRKVFMRGKLESNQKIVEGLSVKNFELISEGANGVKAMVLGEHWFVIDTPEYKRFSNEMELAASRLAQAAGSKNLDAAALRYFDLTLTCLDCHGYIEGKKY